MIKRFLSFLIFLTLTVPLATASNASSTGCPSSTASNISTNMEISALYPNPNSGEDEWIELTNTGNTDADLSYYTLEDATAHPWVPSGLIEAGESLEISGFSFQLNNSNETITLKTSDGTTIDSWTYSTSTKGEVLYRNSTQTSSTTSNTDTTSTPTETVSTPTEWPSFSEALPNPTGSDNEAEWIELYNPYTYSLTLNGLKLDDEDGGSSPYSLSGTLAGESYLLVTITESGITLNNTDDRIRLLGVSNEILWDVPYADVTEGQSYAAFDNSYTWTEEPTPGEENTQTSTPSDGSSTPENGDNETGDTTYNDGDLSDGVTLTEVFPNPEGPDNEDEWIELTNNSGETVNLGNWTIRDASGTTYTFPDTTTIAPGETLVLYRTASGISLNNANETIELLDYTNEVISEVSYESSEEDESYAEIEIESVSSLQASTSGLGQSSFSTWQWVLPSPGAQNPIWKQVKGAVSEWDGEWLTLFDGLSNWTFQAENSVENDLLFQKGNQVLIQASMNNGIYEIMQSQLVSNNAESQKSSFPWEWILSGLAGLSWVTYEIYKKRKKVWTLPA